MKTWHQEVQAYPLGKLNTNSSDVFTNLFHEFFPRIQTKIKKLLLELVIQFWQLIYVMSSPKEIIMCCTLFFEILFSHWLALSTAQKPANERRGFQKTDSDTLYSFARSYFSIFKSSTT